MSATYVIRNILLYLKPVRRELDALQRSIGGGILSVDPVGNSPNNAGATANVNALQLQPASSVFPGVLTAGDQTLGGIKTFSDGLAILGDTGVNTITLKAPTLATSQIYTLPDTTGNSGEVLITDGTGALNWGKSSSVFVGNALFVDDVYGNDATGQPDSPAEPWKTLEGAVAFAGDGDVIFVNPGTYTPAGNLWKKNICWYFSAGTIIQSAIDLFYSNDITSWYFRVYGEGIFTNTVGSTIHLVGTIAGNTYFEAQSIICNNTAIFLEADSGNVHIRVNHDIESNGSTISDHTVSFSGGNLTIKCLDIKNNGVGNAILSQTGTAGNLIIYCNDISSAGNNACSLNALVQRQASIYANNIICTSSAGIPANCIYMALGSSENISVNCTRITANGIAGNIATAIRAISGTLSVFCKEIINNAYGCAVDISGINADISVHSDRIGSVPSGAPMVYSTGGTLRLEVSDAIIGDNDSVVKIAGSNKTSVEMSMFGINASGSAIAINLVSGLANVSTRIESFLISSAAGVCFNQSASYAGRTNMDVHTINAIGGSAIIIGAGNCFISNTGTITSTVSPIMAISGASTNVVANIFRMETISGTLGGIFMSAGTLSATIEQIITTGNAINISGGNIYLQSSLAYSTNANTVEISGGTISFYCNLVNVSAGNAGVNQSGAAISDLNINNILYFNGAASTTGVSVIGTGTLELNTSRIEVDDYAIYDQTSGMTVFNITNTCKSISNSAVFAANGSTYLKALEITGATNSSPAITVSTGVTTFFAVIDSIKTTGNSSYAFNIASGSCTISSSQINTIGLNAHAFNITGGDVCADVGTVNVINANVIKMSGGTLGFVSKCLNTAADAIVLNGGTKACVSACRITATDSCLVTTVDIPTDFIVIEATSTGAGCIILASPSSRYYIEGTYKCSYSKNTAYGLTINNPVIATEQIILKNVVFATTATPTYSIYSNTAATPLRVYGHSMANKPLGLNISLLCGTYEVDTDVV